jgi:hypothetical protein
VAVLLVAGIACGSLGRRAHAQDVDCTTLPAPIIYGTGGSAQRPLIGALAAKLAALPEPITVVYAAPGACNAIQSQNDPNYKITSADKPNYWTPDGKQNNCVLPAAGVKADFGAQNNSVVQCAGFDKLPDGIGDFEGPIGAIAFFVHPQSSQNSISSEAVYYTFGLGASAGGVKPWINDQALVSRTAISAVGIFAALAGGFSPAKLKGIDSTSNEKSVSTVATSPDPEASLGFSSAEVADKFRDQVRILAFQAKGQSCGYWPDSSVTSFDKKNVRDGHYWIWAPAHFLAAVDASGHITNPTVAKFIGYLSGEVAPPEGIDLLKLFIANGNIPKCAMQVTRTGDLGPLASYQPDEPCGCYFDKQATGTTDCKECTTNDDCTNKSAPVCRHGYCEVK